MTARYKHLLDLLWNTGVSRGSLLTELCEHWSVVSRGSESLTWRCQYWSNSTGEATFTCLFIDPEPFRVSMKSDSVKRSFSNITVTCDNLEIRCQRHDFFFLPIKLPWHVNTLRAAIDKYMWYKKYWTFMIQHYSALIWAILELIL